MMVTEWDFEKFKVLTTQRSRTYAIFHLLFFCLTSSLHSLWIIGWLFYFNSHWFCYLDSFVWWRVFMHIILISGALESRALYVFSDKRDRERNFTFSLLHWIVYTIWRTELFFRFPCEILCVFKTQFTVYLQMKWPTRSGDECRQIHTRTRTCIIYIQNARSRVNAYARQWYVNVFIIIIVF